MQAWILPDYTGIESMTLGDFPDPVAKPGEIVLEVEFAALNPADRYLAIRQYPAKPTFPHILGRDGIGKVVAIGNGVAGIKMGDIRLLVRSDVGVNIPGTLAQRVAVEAQSTVQVPPGWSHEQAAAAPLVYITAWQALTQWGELSKNACVLITGASGGVGVATTQLAHALGHTVIALSRSPDKSKTLRELGASFTFDPQEKTWRKQLKEQLGTRRVDLAIDSVGGDLFNEVIETLGMNGRVSVVGRLAGPVPSFNTASLFFRRIKIGGVAIGAYTPEQSVTAWNELLAVLEKTQARPLVDHVFAMKDVPAAFERLEKGPMGKVVIAIGK